MKRYTATDTGEDVWELFHEGTLVARMHATKERVRVGALRCDSRSERDGINGLFELLHAQAKVGFHGQEAWVTYGEAWESSPVCEMFDHMGRPTHGCVDTFRM